MKDILKSVIALTVATTFGGFILAATNHACIGSQTPKIMMQQEQTLKTIPSTADSTIANKDTKAVNP